MRKKIVVESRMQRLTKIFQQSSIELKNFGSDAAFLKTIYPTLFKGNELATCQE